MKLCTLNGFETLYSPFKKEAIWACVSGEIISLLHISFFFFLLFFFHNWRWAVSWNVFDNERDLVFLKHGSVLTLTHRAGREKAVRTSFTLMLLQLMVCLCVWWRRSVHFAVVLHVLPSWSAEVSEFVDGCDCKNNLSWMLHHIYHWTVPVSLPLMRCLWLSQQVVGVEGLCVCVLCCIQAFLVCFYDSNQRLVHQRKLIYLLWSCRVKSPWWSRM